MLLRIVEKENSEILILFNDGRYGKASTSTLREIFEGIETVEDMVGETDAWCFDYDEMEDYPGKTRAYIDEEFTLHIYAPNVFAPIAKKAAPSRKSKSQTGETKYLTITEYAKVVNRSKPRIRVLCSEGRFPGAVRKGRVWLIPEGTPFPKDKRFVANPKRPRKPKNIGNRL